MRSIPMPAETASRQNRNHAPLAARIPNLGATVAKVPTRMISGKPI